MRANTVLIQPVSVGRGIIEFIMTGSIPH